MDDEITLLRPGRSWTDSSDSLVKKIEAENPGLLLGNSATWTSQRLPFKRTMEDLVGDLKTNQRIKEMCVIT